MAETSGVAFGATIGVAIALSVVTFALRGEVDQKIQNKKLLQ